MVVFRRRSTRLRLLGSQMQGLVVLCCQGEISCKMSGSFPKQKWRALQAGKGNFITVLMHAWAPQATTISTSEGGF